MATRRTLRLGPLLALICLGLLLAACGSGSSSSSSGNSEPSAQFLKQKGDEKFVEFGEEASAKEREAANVVVVRSLKARAAGEFVLQCETLNMTGIEEIPGAKNHAGCLTALTKFAQPLAGTKIIRKDTLSGSIAVLRVKGRRGYALYHGNDGNNYAVPLEKEGGTWKLSAVNMIQLGATGSNKNTKPKAANNKS